jgi:hypothetical protein
MKQGDAKDIRKLFTEGTPIDEALRRGVRDALLQHKRSGNPAVVWQDGRVVWIQPEDIPIDEEPGRPAGS